MTGILTSLFIALLLVDSIWLIAILGHAFDAHIVYAGLVVGLVAGVADWFVVRRTQP